jgi:hypothetical protein
MIGISLQLEFLANRPKICGIYPAIQILLLEQLLSGRSDSSIRIAGKVFDTPATIIIILDLTQSSSPTISIAMDYLLDFAGGSVTYHDICSVVAKEIHLEMRDPEVDAFVIFAT